MGKKKDPPKNPTPKNSIRGYLLLFETFHSSEKPHHIQDCRGHGLATHLYSSWHWSWSSQVLMTVMLKTGCVNAALFADSLPRTSQRDAEQGFTFTSVKVWDTQGNLTEFSVLRPHCTENISSWVFEAKLEAFLMLALSPWWAHGGF